MSLFAGKNGLRHQFAKLAPADFAGATTKATAKLWLTLQGKSSIAFIDNTLVNGTDPVDVVICVVHPDANYQDDSFRLDWIEVPGLRVINYSVGDSPTACFEAGTKIMVYIPVGTPTSGALRISAWI